MVFYILHHRLNMYNHSQELPFAWCVLFAFRTTHQCIAVCNSPLSLPPSRVQAIHAAHVRNGSSPGDSSEWQHRTGWTLALQSGPNASLATRYTKFLVSAVLPHKVQVPNGVANGGFLANYANYPNYPNCSLALVSRADTSKFTDSGCVNNKSYF